MIQVYVGRNFFGIETRLIAVSQKVWTMVNCLKIWIQFQVQRDVVSYVLMFELEALSKISCVLEVQEWMMVKRLKI